MKLQHFSMALFLGLTLGTAISVSESLIPSTAKNLLAVESALLSRPCQKALSSAAVLQIASGPIRLPPSKPRPNLVTTLVFNQTSAPDHILILGFHDFGPNAKLNGMTYPEFDAYIKRAKDLGYQNLTSHKLLDFLYGKELVKGKWIMFTFDDGYVGQFEAAKLLQGYGYSVLMGIVSNHVVAGGDSLTQAQVTEILAMGHELASHSSGHCALTLPTADKSAFQASPPGPEASCNPDMFALLTQGEVAFQLKDSKAVMEKTFGVKINAIIYPYGFYNDTVHKEALSSGYQLGFRFPSQVNRDVHSYVSALDLPRLNVQRGSRL